MTPPKEIRPQNLTLF